MGVKIRKRGGEWYVFVNYHGRRKAKFFGTSRQIAEQQSRAVFEGSQQGKINRSLFTDNAQLLHRASAARLRHQPGPTRCTAGVLPNHTPVTRQHDIPAVRSPLSEEDLGNLGTHHAGWEDRAVSGGGQRLVFICVPH